MTCWSHWNGKIGSLVIAYINLLFYIVLMCGISYAYYTLLDDEHSRTFYEIPLIGAITLNAVFLLLSCFLIYGIQKNKPNFMLPWLLLTFLCLILGTIVSVVLWGNTILSMFKEEAYDLITIVIVVPVVFVLTWYLYIVVYQFHKNLTVDTSHRRFYDRSLQKTT